MMVIIGSLLLTTIFVLQECFYSGDYICSSSLKATFTFSTHSHDDLFDPDMIYYVLLAFVIDQRNPVVFIWLFVFVTKQLQITYWKILSVQSQ